MGGPQKLTLTDDLRGKTLGELIDDAHAGPLELRDADGHLVAEIHGRWLTIGGDPLPAMPWDRPSVTTEELLRRCREGKKIMDARTAAADAARKAG